VQSPQLFFVENRCLLCGACVHACPRGVHALDGGTRRIDWEACDDCGLCVEVCPSGALQMAGSMMDVGEVMDVVCRDAAFYRASSGGVTVSGGEPAAQPGFAGAILRACKEAGFHTALDTCGFAPAEEFESLLPVVDLLLFDVKHIDSEVHRALTGMPNELILANLRRASTAGTRVWARVPLIRGLNDDEDDLRRTAGFLRDLGCVEQVTLLPFNVAAGAKYLGIGRRLELDEMDKPYPRERLDLLREVFREAGLEAEVGKG
jgi:pyruvate formate lyase activating enzyme